MTANGPLLDDASLVQRIFEHIDCGTTDLADQCWAEPVANYRSADRLDRELWLLRSYPTPFCPSAALAGPGSYIAREAAGTPLLAVRGRDGIARVFRNACRHRGTQLADDSGCAKAFACPYHGWTYGLDGRLQHVPHEHGFPGLDKEQHGLVLVEAVESGGLVFVTQDPQRGSDAALDALPAFAPADAQLVESNVHDTAANWKIVIDSFLEGYHTRFAHRDTFYPVQYDNVNVVEHFGSNSRVTFPFRSIEKLRSVPPDERQVDGRVLTFVYHLFPNVALITLPEHVRMLVIEPLTTTSTRVHGYTLSMPSRRYEGAGSKERQRASDFVLAGGAEDVAITHAVQRGLPSDANEVFEFGLFEGALTHFHRELARLIGA
jgi:phenylpropionate dioxygenase-like ring-hydroxylating dioxygenase large terminal subunit